MKQRYLIGIDIGTSSCKTVLFDKSGNIICQASDKYPLYRNGIQVEQAPDDYYAALKNCIFQMNKECPEKMADVAGIGLTGQVPTDIFLDENGVPLCNAISWQDTRATKEAARIESHFGKARMKELVGSDVPISASWSASRYLWFSEHMPSEKQRCHKILMPKDYIGFKLTDTYMSDAWSCKSTANIFEGKPSEEVLAFTGFSSDNMPQIQTWSHIRGGLSKAAADELGLKEGIPISNGCSDAPATMLGSGVFLKSGTAFDSAGTSEIIGISADSIYEAEGMMTIPSHVTGALSIVYGPTQSGSSTLLWLMNNIIHTEDWSKTVEMAETVAAGSDGLLFLPYLSGERAPIWNTDIRGMFAGLSSSHTSAHMVRAVMEGVAFCVRHCIDRSSLERQEEVHSIRITGGGSRSELWAQIKADACNVKVETLECPEACALGAAMTVAVGIGMYDSFVAASENMVRVGKTYAPNKITADIYSKAYEKFIYYTKCSLIASDKNKG